MPLRGNPTASLALTALPRLGHLASWDAANGGRTTALADDGHYGNDGLFINTRLICLSRPQSETMIWLESSFKAALSWELLSKELCAKYLAFEKGRRVRT